MSLSFDRSSEQIASEYQGRRPLLMKAAVSSDTLLSWREVNLKRGATLVANKIKNEPNAR